MLSNVVGKLERVTGNVIMLTLFKAKAGNDFRVKTKKNIAMLCFTWKVNFTTVYEAKASSTTISQQFLIIHRRVLLNQMKI